MTERAPASASASASAEQPGLFDRDTAVSREQGPAGENVFSATVSDNWRAGRGPHGGYIAAIMLRALIETVAEPLRAPRSLTVHYARAPEPGPVQIHAVIERAGRSLSTVSARMEQGGATIVLALSAFSVSWSAPERSEIEMPPIDPPDATRQAGAALSFGAPPFTGHLVMQRRLGGIPFSGDEQPMEFGAWLGLAEARPIDALSLAFFCDALIPAPFMRIERPAAAPTVDLTIHFRAPVPRSAHPDPHELCFARVRAGVIHEGFFEEDSVIWAADGTVLAQSRQLAILIGATIG